MDLSFALLLKILFTFSCFLCTIADNFLGLCANPSCSVPIGEGITINRYHAPDRSKLSFEPNEKFTIFVKFAGNRKDLFGIMINEKKGYVPSNLVKEMKSYIPDAELVFAQADFLLLGVNTNNVDSQFQSSSQWSHQDSQPISHSNTRFQEMGQSHWSNQEPQSFMPQRDDSSYQGMEQASSQWPNQLADLNVPHSDSNLPSREQSYVDYDYFHTESIGPARSPSYESQSIYSSGRETYPSYDYPTGNSPYLEPSLQVPVQSDIVIPSSQRANMEHLTHSEGTAPEQQQQLHNDNSHQGSQWLESSFSSQFQDNSHSQNLHSSESHEHNFISGVENSVNSHISSQAPEQESLVKSFDSSINSQFTGESTEFQFSSTDSHQGMDNHDLLDTIAMLQQQGYDVQVDMNQLLYHQKFPKNLNPSQHMHTTLDASGVNYGHSSSSVYENPAERFSEMQASSENLISPFPSSEDIITETSKASLDDQEAHTLQNKHFEEATSSMVMDTTEEENSEDDEVDEDMYDDEADGEIGIEEEKTVLDLTSSKDQDVGNLNETVASSYNLQQNENIVTQPDVETTESNAENSLSPPVVRNDHVPETNLKQDNSHNSSMHKSVLSLDNIKTSNEVEAIKDNVSQTIDIKEENIEKENIEKENTEKGNIEKENTEEGNIEEENIEKENIEEEKIKEETAKDNVTDSSKFGDTPLTQSNSIKNTEVNYSESSIPLQVSNTSVPETTDTIDENAIDLLPDTNEYAKESEVSKPGVYSFERTNETFQIESNNETDILSNREQETELDKILNISELSESEKVGYFNPYQIRNLKEENNIKDSQNADSNDEMEDSGTYAEFDIYGSMENFLEAIRSFIEVLLSWVPEPLYSIIMDVQKHGISPRVPVFTIISSIPCISLIIAIVYIKEKSKEKKLTSLLALSEKNVYVLTAEKNILEEEIVKTSEELKSSSSTLDTERSTYESLKSEVASLNQEIQKTSRELESSIEEIEVMKEREKGYVELVKDHQKAHLDLMEEKTQIENKVLELEEAMSSLNSEIIEKDNDLDELQKEKLEFLQSSKDFEEKLSQLQQNCNQLLKEAEVWNIRVNELTLKLSEVSSEKDELENTLKLKDSEIETLTHLVQNLKSFEELEFTDSEENKSNEEKLKDLLNSTHILIKLQKQEEENQVLVEKLSGEKNKMLEMEVELLEAKSESDKLKLSYNQALQDKAEAKTKLDVLTNYFKDKEIQMQKQIGAQEAVREKREKDADSAERRICLIEQENSSYKYQVASMKQEMEETERNLKSQIATQEKKAHENWIAARAAERKLEDMKQEMTQLRQRLTLLEREQENWVNTRDEVIRPVPKRISGINDESATSQDMNNSMDLSHNIFPPPHPMMLPLDRPLPPLPPPHHLPPFLPPPPLEPQFRMQPWLLPHADSMPGPDYRITPPDFSRGRELTPPRGRHSGVVDGDMVPMQSSPLGAAEMRDSRNSTPPHSLPDFHDIPPPPRPFFPPPGAHQRYPLPPPFRRDMNHGARKTENPSSAGHGTQQSSMLQDNWPHSNSRV